MAPDDRALTAGAPLSVVIPVRDFSRGIKPLVDAWRLQLQKLGKTYEIIVVDDGSADQLPTLTDDALIVFLTHESPRGLGAAIWTGIDRCAHPLVLLLIPEYPYRPTDLTVVLGAIDGADVVAPVRPGRPRPVWLVRLGRLYRFVARVLVGVTAAEPATWYGWRHWRSRLLWRFTYGLRLQDAECGFKLIRRDVLQRCPIQSTGRFALVELMAKANFAGAMMAEVRLSKPGDLPVLKTPFEARPGDERVVFRKPTFNLSPAPAAGQDSSAD